MSKENGRVEQESLLIQTVLDIISDDTLDEQDLEVVNQELGCMGIVIEAENDRSELKKIIKEIEEKIKSVKDEKLSEMNKSLSENLLS